MKYEIVLNGEGMGEEFCYKEEELAMITIVFLSDVHSDNSYEIIEHEDNYEF